MSGERGDYICSLLTTQRSSKGYAPYCAYEAFVQLKYILCKNPRHTPLKPLTENLLCYFVCQSRGFERCFGLDEVFETANVNSHR